MSKELPHRAAVDVLFRPKITGTSKQSQMTGWGMGRYHELGLFIK